MRRDMVKYIEHVASVSPFVLVKLTRQAGDNPQTCDCCEKEILVGQLALTVEIEEGLHDAWLCRECTKKIGVLATSLAGFEIGLGRGAN